VALDPIEITGGLAIGTGLGGAIEDTVKPRLESFRKSQWAAHQDVALAPGEAAAVAAEDPTLLGDMATEATYSGVNGPNFQHLYNVTLTAPGEGTLLELLRRNPEVGIDFTHGLRKAKLEPQWDAALANLANMRIPAPDLAYMVIRDIVPDPFGFDGPAGPNDNTINDMGTLSIDTLGEAALTGWDKQRFEALVGRTGLAPAPVTAANAYFRNIVGYADYLTMIKKGDLRPAYANVILNTARQILTAGEYIEGYLRGWTTQKQMYDGTAQHGMSQADTDLGFDIRGRPTSVRQTYIGMARGAKYPATYADVPEPFRSAIQQSDIRPEWADVAYQNRYSEPSAFVVRTLLTDGAIDATRGATILTNSGWSPDLATLVADHYATGTGTATDPHVGKAETQLWTALHRSYLAGDTTDAEAGPVLTKLGVASGSQPEVLSLWAEEKSLALKKLTPAQVKKAYGDGAINPATGAAWTQPEALAYLIELHYSPADAAAFLAI